MDSGTPFGDELANGAVGRLGLEQLDEGVAGGEPRDAGAVGVVEGNFGEAQNVAVEGQDLVERAHGDAHMGDARRVAGIVSHGECAGRRVTS